jgi:hypothetical protein
MRIQVLSVSAMPLGVQVWVEDSPSLLTVYVDTELLSESGALLLQAVFNDIVVAWERQSAVPARPHLRAVAG